MSRSSVVLDSYAPTEELRGKAQALLDKYKNETITKRLRILSKNMGRHGEALEEETSNFDRQFTEAVVSKKAAGDLWEIGNMIADVAGGELLFRELKSEDGNAHLQLFESLHERLPPLIDKCLEATAAWCEEQRASLDDATDHLDTAVKGLTAGIDKLSSKDQVRRTTTLQYIDETMAMLYEIQNFVDDAKKEIQKARKEQRKAGGQSIDF